MDKIGIRTIIVNFDDEQLPYLSLVQGDAKTRGFDIVICDSDGKEIPPSDDYVVELVATGSNAPDTPYANRHTVKDGKYRVMIPTEALSESGFVFLQLVFYQKSTGAVIHTIEQKCPVYRSRGQEVVESNNLYVDITALRLGIEKIAVMETAYLQVLEDEATRKSNEVKRESNETTRKSAEDKRIADEKIRQSNETTRKSDEKARKSAEDKRVIAEQERKANEAQRQKDKLVAGANVQIDGATNTISATDTITTINGKTGAIRKADITALGIPSQDTVYKKPSSEPISYIQGLQAELDSKIESYGTNPVLNIAVISAGGSTTGIPNNTLILELE